MPILFFNFFVFYPTPSFCSVFSNPEPFPSRTDEETNQRYFRKTQRHQPPHITPWRWLPSATEIPRPAFAEKKSLSVRPSVRPSPFQPPKNKRITGNARHRKGSTHLVANFLHLWVLRPSQTPILRVLHRHNRLRDSLVILRFRGERHGRGVNSEFSCGEGRGS